MFPLLLIFLSPHLPSTASPHHPTSLSPHLVLCLSIFFFYISSSLHVLIPVSPRHSISASRYLAFPSPIPVSASRCVPFPISPSVFISPSPHPFIRFFYSTLHTPHLSLLISLSPYLQFSVSSFYSLIPQIHTRVLSRTCRKSQCLFLLKR